MYTINEVADIKNILHGGPKWIFEPALKYSTGALDVVIVWECGESIESLHVENGEVFEEEIDL